MGEPAATFIARLASLVPSGSHGSSGSEGPGREPGQRDSVGLALGALEAGALAVVVAGVFDERACSAMASAVLEARADWNDDFAGEQHSLGCAFYTHYETGGSRAYFEGAARSDALVERVLPGMQARLRAIARQVTGGHVRARPGWCGAGVHVFPRGGKVARAGGVRHWDLEGLPEAHVARRGRALSLVLSVQVPESAGGLRLWRARYRGREEPTRADLRSESVTCDYRPGDLCVFDSYRLHQIQPFSGARDRISITLHLAEIAPRTWDSWF